ncbi:MAG: [protein-PII] uridylyltransferase, partial [Aeromonas sp.]
ATDATYHPHAPIEAMMQAFYQTTRRVSELSALQLQLFSAAFAPPCAQNKLSAEFYHCLGHLGAYAPERFSHEPTAILRLFYQLAQRPELTGLEAHTLRALLAARAPFAAASDDPALRRLFMALLRHPNGLDLPLTLLHRYGLLAAYLPAWSRIVGQLQFDLFHAYTVDEHTVRLLKNIHHFAQTAGRAAHPLCHEVFARLRKPELLYVAALFHDIGKGRGGDHSQLGAIEAEAFCQAHGLDRYESRLVAWLVRHHLLMSTTAQRRDIYASETISEFARVVGDELHLDLLYCLTVADICATNDTLWNGWKDALLRELYFSTQKALRQGLENPPDLRLRIREQQRLALRLLALRAVDGDAAKVLWQDFKADYFLRHTPAQIAWHTRHILRRTDQAAPLVRIFEQSPRGGSEIFIYCQDVPNLFATVASTLDRKNLTIHDAQIMSSKRHFVQDTFVVLEPNGQPISSDRIQSVREALERALSAPSNGVLRAKPLSKRQLSFAVPIRASFLAAKARDKVSTLELSAPDMPGLLARVGAAFHQQGLNLHSAKIATLGERVEDFFSLTNAAGAPLTEHEQAKLLTQLHALLA